MSNEYFNASNAPSTGSQLSSATMRAEFAAMETGLDKLPVLSGNNNKVLKVNAGASALTTSTITDDGTNVSLTGDLTVAGGNVTVANIGPDADSQHVLPNVAADTVALIAATQTLTNKTLTNPSFSGATANMGTVTTIDINGGTIDGTVIGGATPAAGTFTNLTSTSNATLGDAEATDTHVIKGATTLLADSASAALTITQTGTGNAFVVEDSVSPDSTPFVIAASGGVGVNSVPNANSTFTVHGPITGSVARYSALIGGTIQPDVTGVSYAAGTSLATGSNSGVPYTVAGLVHVHAAQGTFHADSTVTAQYGFRATSTLIGAVTNYGFHSGIAAAAGRWNFYAVGDAPNYFAGETTVDSGLTIGRTAVTAPVESDGNVFSGTYTPTLTNTTNVAASTAFACQYMRVGNVVTVSGRVDVDPTAAASTSLDMTVPVNSNIAAVTQAAGTAACTSAGANGVAGIVGQGTNTVRMTFTASDLANRAWTFSYTYRVV